MPGTIQTEQKMVEVHQSQRLHRVVVPVVTQQQMPLLQKVQRTAEIPQVPLILDVPVVIQSLVPTIQIVVETGEMPQTQHIDKVIELLVGSRQQGPAIQTLSQAVDIGQAQYIPQERVQQRTVEQIIDVLVPPAVDEIVEVPQERISECIVEQVIDVPSAARTHVPVVTHRQVPTIQKVQKTFEVPQGKYVDGMMDMPAVCQRQAPIITTAQRTVEVCQIHALDRVHDAPVSIQRQIPMIEKVQKTVDVQQTQCIGKVVCEDKLP